MRSWQVVALSLALGLAAGSSARSQEPKNPPHDPPASAPAGDEKAGRPDTGSPDSKAVTSTDSKPAETKPADETPAEKKLRPGEKIEYATFAGGCFWSMEAAFEQIKGVRAVVSGFSGGHVANPSYAMVCTGNTGHAESIRIAYDPAVVTYDKLLRAFWIAHDPTTLNAQGDDFGPQYRSVIFYHNEAQKQAALKQYRELTARKAFRHPIVTELQPAQAFFPAEDYHQDYFQNHADNYYSQVYIIPKLKKLKSKLH